MAFVFPITDLSCQTLTLWFDRAQGGTVPNVSAVCDKLTYTSSDNYRVSIAKYLIMVHVCLMRMLWRWLHCIDANKAAETLVEHRCRGLWNTHTLRIVPRCSLVFDRHLKHI